MVLRRFALLAVLGAVFGCAEETIGPGGSVPVTLEPVAQGLSNPLFLTAPPGDLDRLFVVERSGTIHIIRNESVLATPFLDVGPLIITDGGEQGLLGLAFHPEYAANGHFYVNYTAALGHTQVVRYQVSANPDVADPGSAFPIITIDQPFPDHNGGMIAFGPHDGMLYVGMGDGGLDTHGQDRTTLLGDILRLDVDGGSPYAIPADNPFAGSLSIREEIWVSGLRNPWRFSFDAVTGDLYIGDVGQVSREEVSFQPASSSGGENYGWNVMEGSSCYSPSTGCSTAGLTLPIYDYDHSDGCAITGGYVYRGSRSPALVGRYFFADFCGTWLRSFEVLGGGVVGLEDHTASAGPVTHTSSFGVDGAGELYVLSLTEGTVRRIVSP